MGWFAAAAHGRSFKCRSYVQNATATEHGNCWIPAVTLHRRVFLTFRFLNSPATEQAAQHV